MAAKNPINPERLLLALPASRAPAGLRHLSWPSSRTLDVLLAAVLALILARLWLMPLVSSFWVDEMGTAFVVQHGTSDPSLQIAPQVPASVYYALPRATGLLFGFSEASYRLLSVLALALALLLVARIAGYLIHPHAAWFAAFTCLALRGFNYQAADARPCALGALLACAAIWFLLRWLDSARWLDGVFFIAAASMLWRAHLIYWPFYILFTSYAASRLLRADIRTHLHWPAALGGFSVLGLSLIPVLLQAVALNR